MTIMPPLNRTQTISLFCIGTVILLIFASIAFYTLRQTQQTEVAAQAKIQAATTIFVTDTEESIPPVHGMPDAPYLLKLSAQTLSVYAVGSDVPFETYAVSAKWLPDYDRIVLEHGVQVDSAVQLRQLLEDYIS